MLEHRRPHSVARYGNRDIFAYVNKKHLKI